jgi:catechol 2,3-dioxygenase-like lactoylglutathione lyase family enzyme
MDPPIAPHWHARPDTERFLSAAGTPCTRRVARARGRMMASSAAAGMRVSRLLHVQLCCAQAQQTAHFYTAALGFEQIDVEHLADARAQQELGIGGRVRRITLALGAQRVALVQFLDRPGEPYPDDARSSDLIFQHFAIVVSDMAAAMAQLQGASGWTPITRGGPQQLPASSGAVTAFKFRDPEGHPLELLAFAADATPQHWKNVRAGSPFLGIDHSAISVEDAQRSAAFYESLGLTVSQRSVNHDPAQAALDHLPHPVVDVVAMTPEHATPHLELLCYRHADARVRLNLRANDVAASCLVFEASQPSLRPAAEPMYNLVDPDGHRLSIVWPHE